MARVVICGAGIAGPVLAHWLRRGGVGVTVVEQAPAPRSGGYPIDVRGVALDVLAGMGLLPAARAARTGTRRARFVSERGRPIGTLGHGFVDEGAGDRALELPRGELARILGEAIGPDVEYRVADSIEDLRDDGEGVDVVFRRGPAERFDLVIGADGLHSRVRSIAFGPEETYRRDLGALYATFSVPDTGGLRREVLMMNAPGRSAALYAVGNPVRVTALLSWEGPTPTLPRADLDGRRRIIAHAFGGLGWRVPELLERMRTAEELFVDTVSQVRMGAWSRGRIGLVGDAAYAPSFRSGQGTSLAIAGAYVLACEIVSHARTGSDVSRALPRFERRLRPFVERNQALAETGRRLVWPATPLELAARNVALRAMPVLDRLGWGADSAAAQVAEGLLLPTMPAAPSADER